MLPVALAVRMSWSTGEESVSPETEIINYICIGQKQNITSVTITDILTMIRIFAKVILILVIVR